MKRIVSSMVVAFVLIATFASAQNLAQGIKYLYYEKAKSAAEIFKKAYDANPKDPQAIYWHGQGLMALGDAEGAKKMYQTALQEGINDAWVIVGIAQTDLYLGADMNSVKQKWEQAITMSTETKGKNKGKPNAGILNAIGYANTRSEAYSHDNLYAIEKLKQAATIDLTNPYILINMGINYLRYGNEQGGEAVKAFEEAILRDPKNAFAKYRIGRIYYSQGNKDLFEQFFNDAIVADPELPQVYFTLYDYYSQKDVTKAKEYLDKFIKAADPDPNNEYYLADYLFRAANYNESLAKAKQIEASTDPAKVPLLKILFAFNYDRLGDSISAKKYAEGFFANPPLDKVIPSHYDLAIKIFSKFPGSEKETIGFLEKAIAGDSVIENKIEYCKKAAEVWAKAKNFEQQFIWLKRGFDLKPKKAEVDYYYICDAGLKAKQFQQTIDLSNEYINLFGTKPQGYSFNVRAAKGIDTANNLGVLYQAVLKQNQFLQTDTVKYKQNLVNNYYTMLSYYNDVLTDYEKSLQVCDQILALLPGEPQTVKIRGIIESNMKKNAGAPKPPAKPATPPNK